MKRSLTFLLALGLTGCALLGASNSASLQATRWQLKGAEGERFTLQVAGDRLAGMGGCNRYFAAASMPSDGVLSLGPVGSTRMLCPEPALAQQEQQFLQALGQVSRYRIDGQTLELHGSAGQTLLTLVAQHP